jgi:hypothetical protein
MNAADFNPEMPMMNTRGLNGNIYTRGTMKDIGKEWQVQREQVVGKRVKTSRTISRGGDSVLKVGAASSSPAAFHTSSHESSRADAPKPAQVNDYDMGQDMEQAGKRTGMAVDSTSTRQKAGRDFDHEDHCLCCGDGGELICCDLCACSYHMECLDMEQPPKDAFQWFCPHHACAVCFRKAGGSPVCSRRLPNLICLTVLVLN